MLLELPFLQQIYRPIVFDSTVIFKWKDICSNMDLLFITLLLIILHRYWYFDLVFSSLTSFLHLNLIRATTEKRDLKYDDSKFARALFRFLGNSHYYLVDFKSVWSGFVCRYCVVCVLLHCFKNVSDKSNDSNTPCKKRKYDQI